MFLKAAELNVKTALEKGKADKVRVFSPDDLDESFLKEHSGLLAYARGGGYWIWKPYIVLKALKEVNDGDYVCYSDARIVYLRSIKKFISVMNKNKLDIMCFSNTETERCYSKRDALIVMGLDEKEYYEWSGFIIAKKSKYSQNIIEQWYEACKDRKINTDDDNVLGKPNYEGFVENRHDQTAWSLVTKANGIPDFRDPGKRKNIKEFGKEVRKRSKYPQMIYNYHAILENWTYEEANKTKKKKLIKRILRRMGKNTDG